MEVGPAVTGLGADRWGESDFPKEELYSEIEQGFRTEQKCEEVLMKMSALQSKISQFLSTTQI